MNGRHVIAGLLGLAVVACGRSADERRAQEAPQQIAQDAAAIERDAEQMKTAAGQGSSQMAPALAKVAAGSPGSAKVVDFEHLKALLPELDGWTRSNERGEQQTMPVSHSRAHAVYRRDDSRLELEIVDSGLNQMLLAPLSVFLGSGYAERSDDGFKRAAQVGGHPAFEDWNGASRNGEVTAVVGDRYIVRASGDDVGDLAPMRRLVESVDLGKLAALK